MKTWNNETSELLIACDTEVQQLCKTLPFNLSYVKSLCVHYESPTAEAMTKKISGITGFKGLTSPTIKVEGDISLILIQDILPLIFHTGW